MSGFHLNGRRPSSPSSMSDYCIVNYFSTPPMYKYKIYVYTKTNTNTNADTLYSVEAVRHWDLSFGQTFCTKLYTSAQLGTHLPVLLSYNKIFQEEKKNEKFNVSRLCGQYSAC